MDQTENFAELTIGPAAIKNYSRMAYTMWNAFAEFIDNSTQSRLNYEATIDEVLAKEGVPLIVEIDYDVMKRQITIKDNSIGMSGDDLLHALKIAHPTKDSTGRSKYGMGMKTAACWIGNIWRIETCEWSSGVEWSADVDVEEIAKGNVKIQLNSRAVSRDDHYTKIIISNLNRRIQKRTEETIKSYLGSIYRFDLIENRMKLLYCGEEVRPPEEFNFDTDATGKPMKIDIPETKIGGKSVKGFVGVLKQGSGGRKFGGFSMFQNKRQIQGFPNAWKPRNIFGGVDDEGANNLVAQRLTGLIELDEHFKVSHTKDAILYDDDEEEQLEDFLEKLTKDYREYARKRRGDDRGQPWKREKVRELIADMANEFQSSELKDAINTSILPPIDTISATNLKQVENLDEAEKTSSFQVTSGLRVDVWLREISEYEPYVTLSAGAQPGLMHVIINSLHPYYAGLESTDTIQECIRQYIYDAIAEHQVLHQTSKLNPDSIRRMKDTLLRAKVLRSDNAASSSAQPDSAPAPAAATG